MTMAAMVALESREWPQDSYLQVTIMACHGVVELGKLNFESLVRHSYYVCKHNLKPLEGGPLLSFQLRVVRKGKIWIWIWIRISFGFG
jgi:hypothetical protein